MKATAALFLTLACTLFPSWAGVIVENDAFAKSLGGWKKANLYADYSLSGANYRTYKPEISPTPDGGIFVSVRIDHLRGWLASNDFAGLEVTVDAKGVIVSAQSTIAIQGQSIVSDVILGTNEVGKELVGADRAVQIGTDLVSNLTAKLLRENIVEAGRVSFPAVLRHNYNRLFQAVHVEAPVPVALVIPDPSAPAKSEPTVIAGADPTKPSIPAPISQPAEIKAAESKPAEIKPVEVKTDKPAEVKTDKPETPAKDSAGTAVPLKIKSFGNDAPELPVKK